MLAAAVIWVAGIKIANAVDVLDDRFDLGEALGGMALLAVVTNLPEIAIVSSAALRGAVDLGFGHFPLYRLVLIGATAVIVTTLWLFIEKTRFGLIIRAGSRDPEIVRVLGIDVSRVWWMVFGIGTGCEGRMEILLEPAPSGGLLARALTAASELS